MISRNEVLVWIKTLQEVYAENKQHLTELDSSIGDADHGINMDRGFTNTIAELDKNQSSDISGLLKTVAMTLIKTVGGAAGPLYGTFFSSRRCFLCR
jgi:dihydroxyacetone kinase-like protein